VRRSRAHRAFTTLELMIAIAIIAILAVLALGVMAHLRSRAQRVQCMANLKSLYTATELYRQQNGNWPQVMVDRSSDDAGQQYAQQWVAALQPFGATHKTWICPALQQLLGNPDYTDPEFMRVDYFAMPFDDKPLTPHEWARQPWFVERANAHGEGVLIIFTDGSISDSATLIREAKGE
jgi:prepilin-type N-terminal cleavage/methylation domain-containing protein